MDAALAATYADVLSLANATVNFSVPAHFVSTNTDYLIYTVNGQRNYNLVIDGTTGPVINVAPGYIIVDSGGHGEALLTMSFYSSNLFTANAMTVSNYDYAFPAQSFTFRGYDAANNLVATNTQQAVGASPSTATFTFSGMTAIKTLKMSATTNGGLIHRLQVNDLVLSNIEAPPCFAQGTRIATVRGMVAVEDLRVGDVLATQLGAAVRPVVWIGHRPVDLVRHPRPQDVQPVRVAAHAFGPGAPGRDIWLSPDHAVHAAGVLIPIRYLVNGSTIRQERRTRVTYWHIELDAHDVISAEGLACESFLDTGNRDAFVEGEGAMQAHPDFARAVWAAEACAPLLIEGPAVEATRRRLTAEAEALGHRRSDEAALHLAVGARRLWPLAGSGGWHALEPGGRWTDGDGVLHLPEGAEFVEVGVAEAGARYLEAPATQARQAA